MLPCIPMYEDCRVASRSADSGRRRLVREGGAMSAARHPEAEICQDWPRLISSGPKGRRRCGWPMGSEQTCKQWFGPRRHTGGGGRGRSPRGLDKQHDGRGPIVPSRARGKKKGGGGRDGIRTAFDHQQRPKTPPPLLPPDRLTGAGGDAAALGPHTPTTSMQQERDYGEAGHGPSHGVVSRACARGSRSRTDLCGDALVFPRPTLCVPGVSRNPPFLSSPEVPWVTIATDMGVLVGGGCLGSGGGLTPRLWGVLVLLFRRPQVPRGTLPSRWCPCVGAGQGQSRSAEPRPPAAGRRDGNGDAAAETGGVGDTRPDQADPSGVSAAEPAISKGG